MIAFLDGTLQKKLDKACIILSQGVGYLVQVGSDFQSTLPEGKKVQLYIHTMVREDSITLYGFSDIAAWRFFQQLIGVSGIGGKTAMTILNQPLSLVCQAIEEENIVFLSGIPGLGKKTSARLILELKGKIPAEVMGASESPTFSSSRQQEALDALLSLGYERPGILRFFQEYQGEVSTSEELVKAYLQKA